MKKIKSYLEKSFVVLAFMLVFGTLSFVYAERSVADYDYDLPRFLGSSQTSALYKVSLSRAVNNNEYIGGGYKMYSRVYSNRSGNILTNEAVQRSGDRVSLTYFNPEDAIDTYVYTRMWTAYDVTVKVNSYGSWSPNSRGY